jgi:hypothetical protein
MGWVSGLFLANGGLSSQPATARDEHAAMETVHKRDIMRCATVPVNKANNEKSCATATHKSKTNFKCGQED